MVQCEMCGAETSSPRKIQVEGARLDVCANCTDFGTTIETDRSDEGTSTKYSTGKSSSSTGGQSSTNTRTSPSSTGRSSGGSDLYDEMDELATDYDTRIRAAREDRELSQSELADELNEKASLIRKLERGETLPSDGVQKKLERFLDISLTDDGSGSDTEWESDSSSGTYTLGDVVKRKD